MECKRFENYIKKNEGVKIEIHAELKEHIGECRECKKMLCCSGF